RYVAIAVERTYVDAHALGDPALAVVHEDILPSVRVPADEVAGIAFESHVPSVGGDRRREAEDVAAIPLHPRRVDAHELGGATLAVVNEAIEESVRVPVDKVVGAAPERHVATVGGDRRIPAVVIPLRSCRVDAHALGCAALAVAHEDVEPPVRVAADECA